MPFSSHLNYRFQQTHFLTNFSFFVCLRHFKLSGGEQWHSRSLSTQSLPFLRRFVLWHEMSWLAPNWLNSLSTFLLLPSAQLCSSQLDCKCLNDSDKREGDKTHTHTHTFTGCGLTSNSKLSHFTKRSMPECLLVHFCLSVCLCLTDCLLPGRSVFCSDLSSSPAKQLPLIHKSESAFCCFLCVGRQADNQADKLIK